MKKLLFTIFVAICLILPLSVQAITSYNANGLTGGTQRDLDYVSVSDLNNGDRAIVLTGTIKYHFKYDSTATDSETVSTHPFKVRPDDYSTAGVWIEQELASSSVDAAIIATGAVTPVKLGTPPGLLSRAKFTWTTGSDKICLSAFSYDHQGTAKQLVYSSSSMTFEFQNLGASDWSYLYLDDSAIVTAGTNLISTTQLIDATTEPAWSDTKNGWYNGEDKVLFAVWTSGGSAILEFHHQDIELVLFGNQITVEATIAVATSFADVTAFTMPIFTRAALATFYSIYADTAVAFAYRTNGQDSASGHLIDHTSGGTTKGVNTFKVITDAAHIIEVMEDGASTNTLTVYQNGWYFPIGM